MAVHYPFNPVELTRGRRWLHRWWPSRRLGADPQQDLRVEGRYAPVSIANWKLVPSIARALLAQRVVRPLTFDAGLRLTVVIPFRDREQHLQQLLPALTAKLREQRIQYRILVVEQRNPGLFNRGRLLNIGLQHAAPVSDYYCLHDVDAVPRTANYLCPSQPLRLVNKLVDARGASQRTDYYFSGAVSIRKEQVFAANGFSNEYWGWGKEDDDFFFRLLMAGLLCYYDLLGEFEDLPNPTHQQVRFDQALARRRVKANRARRSRLLRGLEDPGLDGLNTLRYEVVDQQVHVDHEKLGIRW